MAGTNIVILSSPTDSIIARRAECRVIIEGYDPHQATTQEMQEYADCIDMIHPKQLEASEVMYYKILFVCAIIGAVYGMLKTPGYQDPIECIMAGVMGFLLAPFAVVFFTFFAYGLVWLFN